jgi:hypothetical protein
MSADLSPSVTPLHAQGRGEVTTMSNLGPRGPRNANYIHGMSRTPEHKAYRDAKRRCTRPKHKYYAFYGGRGIEFRFASFLEFYAAVGSKPKEGRYLLDRIDNDGHYETGNVRWATQSQSASNRRKGYKMPRPWPPKGSGRKKKQVL